MKEFTSLSRSPNIAFLKYWGKIEHPTKKNLACNPSLSMTLQKAQTKVEIRKHAGSYKIFFLNEQVANAKETHKVLSFLNLVAEQTQTTEEWNNMGLEIRSSNNFPTGAGIASSASAFAALTDAYLDYFEIDASLELRSKLARQGSGSACRSVSGPFMKWVDESAIQVPVSWKLYDTILIVDDQPKEISSREGHRRALLSPYFEKRQSLLPQRLQQMEEALAQKDIHRLGSLLETEALDMHIIAMTSSEPIFYLKPNTWALIEALRKISNREAYFTIDAGPNLHLISEKPLPWIKAWLEELKISAKVWEDENAC